MLPALAGANLIYGIGMLDSGLTWDYAQAVMENEMIEMVLQTVKGISISDEQIAFDVVKQVGPGGEFISHDHTFEHMREQSQGKLIDRRSREVWEASGRLDFVEKAYEKALDIIKNHKPKPLPEDVKKSLDSIFEEAEALSKERKTKEAS